MSNKNPWKEQIEELEKETINNQYTHLSDKEIINKLKYGSKEEEKQSMTKADIKEIVKELIRNKEIDIEELLDEPISKKKTLKSLHKLRDEMKNDLIKLKDKNKNKSVTVFLSDNFIQRESYNALLNHLINEIENGNLDKKN